MDEFPLRLATVVVADGFGTEVIIDGYPPETFTCQAVVNTPLAAGDRVVVRFLPPIRQGLIVDRILQ